MTLGVGSLGLGAPGPRANFSPYKQGLTLLKDGKRHMGLLPQLNQIPRPHDALVVTRGSVRKVARQLLVCFIFRLFLFRVPCLPSLSEIQC